MLFYEVLRSLGIDVDIRHADADLSGYRLVVAPALQLMGDERARHLTEAARTAHLVFGPRTAYRTPSGRVHEDGQPGPLRDLLGLRLLNFDGLRPGLGVQVGTHPVETWAESYEPLGGEVTHTYADGPACRSGRRRPQRQRHHRRRLEPIAGRRRSWPVCSPSSRSRPPELPEGVRVARRGAITTWMNFNLEPVTLADGTTLGPVSFQQRTQEANRRNDPCMAAVSCRGTSLQHVRPSFISIREKPAAGSSPAGSE